MHHERPCFSYPTILLVGESKKILRPGEWASADETSLALTYLHIASDIPETRGRVLAGARLEHPILITLKFLYADMGE